MDCSFFPVLLLPVLWVAFTHAALTPQEYYWRTVLPDTPMPSSIRDMLPEGNGNDGFHHVADGKGKPVSTAAADDPMTSMQVCRFFYVYIICFPPWSADAKIVKTDNTSLFFLHKDLHPGAEMNLDFTRATLASALVPRREANSIPFSSKKLPQILHHFSIQPNTAKAKNIKNTLETCEHHDAAEENKHCATSLESMIDFASSNLGGHHVQAIVTEVVKEGTPKQQYTIASSGMVELGSRTVACHPMPYAYLMFYCHVTSATKAYMVPLVGKDGAKVDAVAVCHTDTSAWNPNHVAFQVLNIKPGTAPVCHFLPGNHIVWAPLTRSTP